MALFRSLPNDNCFLFDGGGLPAAEVLAPDINFFLNSRQEGLLSGRWRSLFLPTEPWITAGIVTTKHNDNSNQEFHKNNTM